MASYLHRLIERAAGAGPVLPSFVRTPQLLGEGRVDHVDETVPPLVAPRITNVVAESTTAIERHVVPASQAAPTSPVEPAPPQEQREVVHLAAPPPAERGAPAPVVLVQPPLPASIVQTALRLPDAASAPEADRWLAPTTAVPAIAEPAPAATRIAAPVPAVANAPRSVVPSPPPAVAPSIEDRPTLTIGRLLVEVRNQPPAPAPTTTIVHTAAPTAQSPVPSVLHRNFGLGQS